MSDSSLALAFKTLMKAFMQTPQASIALILGYYGAGHLVAGRCVQAPTGRDRRWHRRVSDLKHRTGPCELVDSAISDCSLFGTAMGESSVVSRTPTLTSENANQRSVLPKPVWEDSVGEPRNRHPQQPYT